MTGPDRPVRQPANARTSSLLTCNLRPESRLQPRAATEWTWSSGEMRHAVLGAGGIGGLHAAALARTGAEVTLLLGPALGGRMPRAVLALLLLRANEVVSSDQLVEELWAGAPPASGAKGLHVHVSRLRRALAAGHSDPDGERLVTTAGGYVLRVGPEELDVKRCERLIGEGRSLLAAGRPNQALAALSGAVELWRGDVLADFQYDAFAQGEIARLGELRAAVLEERIAVEMLLGREAQVLGELERLVREYPYRERLRGQLMLALYRTGRQAEALAAYRAGRSALVDELGIEPSVHLRQLHEAILAQDRALLQTDPGQPAALAGATTDGRAPGHVHLPVQATPLIG